MTITLSIEEVVEHQHRCRQWVEDRDELMRAWMRHNLKLQSTIDNIFAQVGHMKEPPSLLTAKP